MTGSSYAGGGNYNDSNVQDQAANSAYGGPGRGQGGMTGGGNSGSGVVIVSYDGTKQLGQGGTVTTRAGKTIHTFTGPGTYTG